VSSAFAFHVVCVWYGLKSAPTHHNHSLTTGPIFGVQLTGNRLPGSGAGSPKLGWSVPRKSWTSNKRRIRPVALTSEWPGHSGRGQAGDSLPGSGAVSPRLGFSQKEAQL
jgi:hypothetical protein